MQVAVVVKQAALNGNEACNLQNHAVFDEISPKLRQNQLKQNGAQSCRKPALVMRQQLYSSKMWKTDGTQWLTLASDELAAA